MIAIQQCQLKTGVCTKEGTKKVFVGETVLLACAECAKANKRSTSLRDNRICPLCGEHPKDCEHSKELRLLARQDKLQFIQEYMANAKAT